jgi:hypothetical protein
MCDSFAGYIRTTIQVFFKFDFPFVGTTLARCSEISPRKEIGQKPRRLNFTIYCSQIIVIYSQRHGDLTFIYSPVALKAECSALEGLRER